MRVTVTLSSQLLFAKDRARLLPQFGGRLREVSRDLVQRDVGTLRIVG